MRFFHARAPTAASFVQQSKLLFGQPIDEAFRRQYCSDEADDQEAPGHVSTAISVSQVSRPIEFVGMGRSMRNVARFQTPFVIDLSRQSVNDAPPTTRRLADIIPKRSCLILRDNFMSSWQRVFANVIDGIGAFDTLDLSGNLIDAATSFRTDTPSKKPVVQVNTLVFNRMKLDYAALQLAVQHFEAVRCLVAVSNCVRSLPASSAPLLSHWNSMRLIDLQDNSLQQWSDIAILGLLENLEELNLSCNRLVDVDATAAPFTRLRLLNLRSNKLESWNAVNALECFPALTTAILADNPFYEAMEKTSGEESARCFAVAMLSRLESCNHSAVLAEERKGAELYYLRQLGSEWSRARGNAQELAKFVSHHRRYQTLLAKYEFDASDIGITRTRKRLADRLLKVTLQLNGAADRCISKSLPPQMSVAKLKRLVERTFQLQSSEELLLTFSTPGAHANVRVPLDQDHKDVAYYGVVTGDTVHIATG